MNIKVMLFGQLADTVGKSTILLENCHDTKSIKEKAVKEFPGLSECEFLIAVNKKIAKTNQEIEEGCEIAFLPPFAGG